MSTTKHPKVALSLILMIVFASLITKSSQGVVAGPACFGAAITYCLLMGPFKFAALVGVILDIAGCTPMAMASCAAGLGIPMLCFDRDTFVGRITTQGNTEQVKVESLREGDIVVNTNWLTKDERRTVIKGVKLIQEESNFVKITFDHDEEGLDEANGSIEVTEEHEMIIADNKGQVSIKPAVQVSVGDKLLSLQGTTTVTQVSSSKKAYRVQISTEHGTIVANGVLTSTHCSGRSNSTAESSMKLSERSEFK